MQSSTRPTDSSQNLEQDCIEVSGNTNNYRVLNKSSQRLICAEGQAKLV